MIAGAAALAAAHPLLAVLIAFVGAVVEAVPVLGIVVPGTPMLMAVAGTVALAGMPMLPIVLAGVAGAVLGDVIAFWLGAHYQRRIRAVWPFSGHGGLLPRAKRFFARYGVLSVAMARFLPVLRSVVPLVAGMTGMPVRRFLAANVASAAVWAPAHVFAAELGGFAVRQWQAGHWQTAALAAGGLALAVAGALLLHRRYARHYPAAPSCSTNTAPPRSRGSAHTEPPCAAAISATIASPRPEPPGWAPWPRWKRSKIASRSASGTPGPRSSTRIVAGAASSTTTVLDRIEALLKSTGDHRLVQWICQRAGGFFILNPKNTTHPHHLIPATNQIVQEFADLLAVIANATADDKITKTEATQIRARWEELKTVTEGFVAGCEQENFDHIRNHAAKRSATGQPPG